MMETTTLDFQYIGGISFQAPAMQYMLPFTLSLPLIIQHRDLALYSSSNLFMELFCINPCFCQQEDHVRQRWKSYAHTVTHQKMVLIVEPHLQSKISARQRKSVFTMYKRPFVKTDLFCETATIISWFKCQSLIIR